MSSTAARPVRSAPTVSLPKLGSQFEPDAEHQHQHQPDPEDRRGVEAQSDDRDHAVEPAPGMARRDHARDHAGQQRQQEGGAGQQQRRRQPLQDQRGDAALLRVGEAEVELRHMAEIDAELGDQRLVEAELLAQLVDQLLVRRPGLAGDDAGRVAGGGVDQQEADHRDRQHDQHHLDQAPAEQEQEPRHGQAMKTLSKQACTPVPVVIRLCHPAVMDGREAHLHQPDHRHLLGQELLHIVEGLSSAPRDRPTSAPSRTACRPPGWRSPRCWRRSPS